MSEDPKHPWGTGETRYRYAPPVERVVQLVFSEYPHVRPNTYVCHPWCGWGRWSVDFWGNDGRGDPIGRKTGISLVNFLLDLPGPPNLRHLIYEHDIWTSWGGWSHWDRDDHTAKLRHVHVTYWRPVDA